MSYSVLSHLELSSIICNKEENSNSQFAILHGSSVESLIIAMISRGSQVEVRPARITNQSLKECNASHEDAAKKPAEIITAIVVQPQKVDSLLAKRVILTRPGQESLRCV